MGWINTPIGVGDQRIKQRADFQKLMPIAAGARQSRHLDAEHETDIAEPDFGDDLLKAQAALDAGPERPRSSSMTTICSRPQPYCAARLASAYYSRSISGDAQPAEPWIGGRTRSPDGPGGVEGYCRRSGRCGAGQGSPPSTGASPATAASRIRSRAICPTTITMRPLRSRGSFFPIDAGRSLIARSKPTRQRGQRCEPVSVIRRAPSNYERQCQWDIERAFRTSKSLFETRPIYRRDHPRPRLLQLPRAQVLKKRTGGPHRRDGRSRAMGVLARDPRRPRLADRDREQDGKRFVLRSPPPRRELGAARRRASPCRRPCVSSPPPDPIPPTHPKRSATALFQRRFAFAISRLQITTVEE